MTVGELRELLTQYPDDTRVCLVDNVETLGDELDCKPAVEPAVNHPDTRVRGSRTWRFESQHGPAGERVVVIY